MVDQENKQARLTRLILVDSFCPDRIVELPVSGGAVITGRNGRGKTSLLQLILLFFGETPNRIVSGEAGRKNFVGYYLPRLTSYLAYEYQRADGQMRLVIAYADRHGERVFYRFVRQGFDVRQFVTEDDQLVRATDLLKHLRLQGFDCASKQVETQSDYRHIIQAVPSTSTNRQYQRQMNAMLADYSFASPRQSLPQIEKIVSGMFRRKTNFDDLQSMVIDCVADEGDVHEISGDRKKLEDWPQHYRAYQAVMAFEAPVQEVLQQESELQAVEAELSQSYARFSALQRQLQQQAQESAQQRTVLQAEMAQQQKQFEQQHTELLGQQQTCSSQADVAEQRLQRLQQQFDDYAQAQIEQKAERLTARQTLRQELAGLENRREILLGEQQNISARYQRLKQTETAQFNQFREQQLTQRQQITGQCEQQLQQQEQAFQQQQQASEQVYKEERVQYEQQIQQISEQLGACRQALKHPQPTSSALALVQQKQMSLQTIHQERQNSEEQLRQLQQHYQQVRQQFDEQESAVSAATRQVQQCQDKLQQQQQLLAPQQGTLLYFLKTEHPDWAQDIARVIDPQLLTRTDLEPASVDKQASIYGLSVNLQRLQAHAAAEQSTAEMAVEQAEQALARAQQELSSARAQLAERDKARQQAQQRSQQQEQRVNQLKMKQQSAQAELDSAQEQCEHSRHQAEAQAQQQREAVQQQLHQAREQLNAYDQQYQQQCDQQRQSAQQQRQVLMQQRDQQLETLDQQLQQQRQRLDHTCEQLDRECEQALQQQGVDTDKLKQIDHDMQKIRDELVAIDGFAQQVEQWHYWRAHEWSQYAAIEQQAQQLRQQAQVLNQQLQQLDTQWQQQRSVLQQQLDDTNRHLHSLQRQISKVEHQLLQLSAFQNDEQLPCESSWDYETLLKQSNQLQIQQDQLLKSIVAQLKQICRGFRQYPGSPPEQYLDSAVADLSTNPDRDWIGVLRDWFEREHQEYKRLLLMEAVSIAGGIQAFYQGMNEFDRRVKQFNRELQQHLDTSLSFDSISSIQVEVVSTLRELQYWPAIEAMAQAYEDWNHGLGSELPPAEFAHSLEALLQHWEVKAGIRADLTRLIRLQGEVVENGNRRLFKRASDLEVISSNGLSYLVLATIFVAFINRIRRNSPVNIVWALDELKDLDAANVVALVALLQRNHITLVSAFPDPDPDTLALFQHCFTIEPDRRLAQVQLDAVAITSESLL